MRNRRFALPAVLTTALDETIHKLGFAPQNLGREVRQLSEHFHGGLTLGPTPWSSKKMQAAYLAYFFTLNAIRLLGVLEQINETLKGFEIENVLEFGSGPGLGQIMLQSHKEGLFKDVNYQALELSGEAQALNLMLAKRMGLLDPEFIKPTLSPPKNTLGFFCYSLNEVSTPPPWIYACEHLLFIEPSTRDCGRSLLQLRSQLLQKGFFAHAPCTHQGLCPLLSTKSDWCHDRVFTDLPEWFSDIEKEFGVKNDSVTLSYLLMSKKEPHLSQGWARVIGDTLFEKGKVRQMICRGEKREFLAWLRRDGSHRDIPRGVKIEIPQSVQLVSNEIRGL